MSIDPLSGQGAYLALDGGIRAAAVIDRTLRGDSSALPEYRGHTEALFAACESNRIAHYSAETRWSQSPFWARRLPVERTESRVPALH